MMFSIFNHLRDILVEVCINVCSMISTGTFSLIGNF